MSRAKQGIAPEHSHDFGADVLGAWVLARNWMLLHRNTNHSIQIIFHRYRTPHYPLESYSISQFLQKKTIAILPLPWHHQPDKSAGNPASPTQAVSRQGTLYSQPCPPTASAPSSEQLRRATVYQPIATIQESYTYQRPTNNTRALELRGA